MEARTHRKRGNGQLDPAQIPVLRTRLGRRVLSLGPGFLMNLPEDRYQQSAGALSYQPSPESGTPLPCSGLAAPQKALLAGHPEVHPLSCGWSHPVQSALAECQKERRDTCPDTWGRIWRFQCGSATVPRCNSRAGRTHGEIARTRCARPEVEAAPRRSESEQRLECRG